MLNKKNKGDIWVSVAGGQARGVPHHGVDPAAYPGPQEEGLPCQVSLC